MMQLSCLGHSRCRINAEITCLMFQAKVARKTLGSLIEWDFNMGGGHIYDSI